ncbi:hypothetical protein JCM3774_003583 [Rhodotorula dairenensis]
MVGDDDLDAVLEELNAEFEGRVKVVDNELFLGMRVRRSPDGTVSLDQRHYAQSILDRFFPDGLNGAQTPLDSSYQTIEAATEDEHFDCPYRELLGALVYLTSCTRPDLAFAVAYASRFAACPAERHWSLLKRICRFLRYTVSLALVYSAPEHPADAGFRPEQLRGYTDADHAADRETRRSVGGYVFVVGDPLDASTAISWASRRQRSVAISSTESEYMALSEAAREGVWLRQLLGELGFTPSTPTRILGDNTGSLLLACVPGWIPATQWHLPDL